MRFIWLVATTIVVMVAVLSSPLHAQTLKDRVRETTATEGTGTVTLAGAVTGFNGFSTVGDGNTTYYAIAHRTQNEWEMGVGTYTLSGSTLSRDTIISSSNSDSIVSFSAGTKDVFVTVPASKVVFVDSAGVVVNEAPYIIDVTNAEALLVRKNADGGDVLTVDTTNTRIGVGGAPGTILDLILADATTNVVTDVLTINHTGGTVAAGFGSGIIFELEDAGGSEEQASIDVSLDVVTDGAEEASIIFRHNVAGTMQDSLRLDGTSGFAGFFDTTPDSPLEILSTVDPQFRISHTDGVDDATFGVDASGFLTIMSSGGAIGLNTAPVSGSVLTLPQESDVLTPTISFGDGDTGFFEVVDDVLRVAVKGVSRFQFVASLFKGVALGSSFLANEVSSATNPTLGPDSGSEGTGIGGVTGTVSIITGGVEAINIDASQQVGIGEGTPGTIVDILLADATTNVVTDMLTLNHTGGTVAAGFGSGIIFELEDAGGSEEQASIDVSLDVVTDGAEEASIIFRHNVEGTMQSSVWIDGTAGYVGIGAEPTYILDVQDLAGSATVRVHSNAGNADFVLDSGGADKDSRILFLDDGAPMWRFYMDTSLDRFRFFDDDANVNYLVFDRSPMEIRFNDADQDMDFVVSSDTIPDALKVRGDTGAVGIGDDTADSPLEILSTTVPQLRVSHTDGVDDATFGVDANGDLTILATGGNIDFGNETLTTTGSVATGAITLTAGRLQGVKGGDVASADEILLGAGNYFDVTGTTQIHHVTKTDWQAGAVVVFQFDASVVVTHDSATPTGTEASLWLLGAGDFSATANDTMTTVYDGVYFRELGRSVN